MIGDPVSPIISDRLELVAMTPDFLRASLAGSAHGAAQLLGRALPEDWPGDHRKLLELRLGQVEADPSLQPWLVRAMVCRKTGTVVGHIGFHSAPGEEYLRAFSPDGVEFGFTVYPSFRRRGYAREAATALMNWATEQHGVNTFIMTIRPDNVPSQRLARQLGFTRIGSHIDEVDGIEDVLEFRVAPK
jgi:RimJ/RimL family protein N-acetyltransferase